MDGKKVLEVIGIYKNHFEESSIRKIDSLYNQFMGETPYGALTHCHAMLDEMEKFVAEGRMEKVFRGLGFIQGCLWATGQYTLEDLKNHNRSDSVPKTD